MIPKQVQDVLLDFLEEGPERSIGSYNDTSVGRVCLFCRSEDEGPNGLRHKDTCPWRSFQIWCAAEGLSVVTDFVWRQKAPAKGILVKDMSTLHLFRTVRMLLSEDNTFGPAYTRDYRQQALEVMQVELAQRKNVPNHMKSACDWMLRQREVADSPSEKQESFQESLWASGMGPEDMEDQ